jgi:hypothetical protein
VRDEPAELGGGRDDRAGARPRLFSELEDAKSLFLTANADTVYALGVLALTIGPMVLEVPPDFLAPLMITGSVGSSTAAHQDLTGLKVEDI